MSALVFRRYMKSSLSRVISFLSSSSDFSDYAKAINENVLDGYKSNFNTLELVYTQDDLMAAQKIFKASLRVACGTFIQTEIYDVFIINS